MAKKINNKITKLTIVFLALVAMLACIHPLPAHAQENDTVVRVGWYESPFNSMDRFGRRSGYAYDYQQKIAAYTGWRYEYIEGSFSELLDMVQEGKIDLLSDVSYTPTRAENMLFSAMAMGSEDYYVYVSPSNANIIQERLETLEGKRVGVIKNSVQEQFFHEWEERYGIYADVVELTGSEEESLRLLENGTLDAYITLDAFGYADGYIPVCKIGSSDVYFTVNKERPDLLKELDTAMNRIYDENRYFNHQMFEKYLRNSGANMFLTTMEREWLREKKVITVAYIEDNLPYCASDGDGNLTGALRDYLDIASHCIKNAEISFASKAYPTIKDAFDALEKGKVDCVFPIFISNHQGEVTGFLPTVAFMSSQVQVLSRTEDFSVSTPHTVAIVKDSPNDETFLMDNYSDYTPVYYDDIEKCMQAIASGFVDCMFISDDRLSVFRRMLHRYDLNMNVIDETINYAFAIRRKDDYLYSILNKIAGIIQPSAMSASLYSYSIVSQDAVLEEYIEENLGAVISVGALLACIILTLLLYSVKMRNDVVQDKQLISAVELDTLSGLYNSGFFFEYAARMLKEHPDWKMDAVAVDIEQFHAVNSLNGREYGDKILRLLGNEIKKFVGETNGIASRVEGDQFNIFCKSGQDYEAFLDKLLNVFKEHNIRLRMGVMPWQEDVELVVMFDRAWSACNMVRGDSRVHLVIYNDEMREKEIYHQRLLKDLSRALEEKQLQVYYQPKYNIQCDPPRLTSAEALIRWKHPEFGMISPADFIPLFEGNGYISQVDNYVWKEAARQIAEWRNRLGVTLPVSVNVSRVDIYDPQLENTLDKIVCDNGLEAKLLKLEVTESAYTENGEQMIQMIDRLRDKGFEIEMDDFGSGYSSLNMLSSMPIDVLKMDMAFVRNIEHNDKDLRLVILILDIARNMNVPVVAEGVENEKQMAILKDAGCALVQGYYFSRPLPAQEFERFLADA